MTRRPPRPTLTYTLLPYTTLLRSCERWPLHADTWRRRLPGYLLASVACSLLHVGGMVLLRKLGYIAMGDHYDPGNMLWMRSEEHKSELQSLMRISYAVICLKTKTKKSNQISSNPKTTSKIHN